MHAFSRVRCPASAWTLRSRSSVLVLMCVLSTGCGAGMDSNGTLPMIGGDLIRAGGTVTVADSASGDVMIVGGDLTFTGVTGGDNLAAGGNVTIGGRVGGSARIAGGNITLEGVVGRNVTIAGGEVKTAGTSSVLGNAYIAGGDIELLGTFQGHTVVGGGNVEVNGSFMRDLTVDAGQLRVGPNARIAGDLRYRVAPEDVLIDPAAVISGQRIAMPPRPQSNLPRFLKIVWLLGFLVAGIAVVALFPQTIQPAAAAVRDRFGGSIGVGLLLFVGIPVAALLIAITVVGIPLAVIAAAVYGIALYLGRAITAVFIGRLVVRGEHLGRGQLVGAFIVGAVALLALGFVPFIGGLVWLVSTAVGIGAFALAARERSRLIAAIPAAAEEYLDS